MPRTVWEHICKMIEQRKNVTREDIGYTVGHGGRTR